MNTAYLLLGSNLGDRKKFLSQAVELLGKAPGKIITRSALYNTQPWGTSGQDDFLNQAVCLETPLSAPKLLEHLLQLEENLGRKRNEKWEARTIDIDILFFNSEIVQLPHLIIPHPFVHQRKFALSPLFEIAGEYIHPVLNKSVKKLLSECEGNLLVSRL
jgi:2-amino-4-hydroxy-6-hydroxymethyldihydropteridine diphosphokinase